MCSPSSWTTRAAEANADEEAPAATPEDATEEAPEAEQNEEAPAAAEQAPTQRVCIKSKGGANIRSGPDASASKITYGYKGDSFPLLGEDDVNGQVGYVAMGMCEVK